MSAVKQRSLSTFTKDEVNKAIEKANNELHLEENVVLLTEDRYDEALGFIKEFFFKDEPINTSLGVQWSQEIADLWFLPAFRLNLSLVMVDPANDKIIALRTTTLSKRDSRFDTESIRSLYMKEIFQILSIANNGAKYHEQYDVDEAIHFLGLAVNREYRGRGLATKLVKFKLKLLENLGVSPLYVKAEGSSNYSKRVFEKLGFDTLNEFVYADYIGKYVKTGEYSLRYTGEHKSMKTYGYKVC